MNSIATLALVGFATFSSTADLLNFDKDKTGRVPPGWHAGVTGAGKARWMIENDATAPSKPRVLKQFGFGTFAWCVKGGTRLTDGYVQVKLKPIAGKEDQAGGVIWRWKDAHNYYVARANALENNVTIYHTLNGKREAFKSTEIKVAAHQWHSLRADFKGRHFVVTFDGKKVIEADDDKISGAGEVGVWTKADSITAFDDFAFGSK